MHRAIVNVAVGSWYPEGQRRLLESLAKVGETADPLMWAGTYPPGSPTHQETPYAMKPYVFVHARTLGYQSVIWLDASCYVTRPLPWEQIETEGYYLGQEGWSVGQWCAPDVLPMLGLTREEALGITLMDGKIIGLDFTHRVANDFLDQWLACAQMGAFNGDWSEHRHDITCGAAIADRLGMRLTPHPVTIAGPNDPPHPESYVNAQGMS